MKPSLCSGDRYRSVCLTREGVPKGFLVHRLVCLSFNPNPDGKTEVNHIDGDRENNQSSNLEWCTRSENMKHAHKSGLIKKGGLLFSGDSRRCDKSKLGIDDVLEIRKRFDEGEKARKIWLDYKNINYSNIRRCCKRESFKDIM